MVIGPLRDSLSIRRCCVMPDVFRHRLVLTYEALSEGMTADALIGKVMRQIAAPEKPLEAHVKAAD